MVDDEIVCRTKLAELYSRYGSCDKAPNGEIAMKLFQEAHKELVPYDLVSMDVEMPGMTGTEVVRRMREIETLLDVPPAKAAKVLMVTTREDIKTVAQSYGEGCDEYLNKPATSDDVREALLNLGLSV